MRHRIPQATYPDRARVTCCGLAATPISIWSCSEWGFPCRACYQDARCALTAPFHPYSCLHKEDTSGIFSVALSIGSRLPGITWHSTLWSPDFPPFTCVKSDCLTDFARDNNGIMQACRLKSIAMNYSSRVPINSSSK